jgi:hypothetical protein
VSLNVLCLVSFPVGTLRRRTADDATFAGTRGRGQYSIANHLSKPIQRSTHERDPDVYDELLMTVLSCDWMEQLEAALAESRRKAQEVEDLRARLGQAEAEKATFQGHQQEVREGFGVLSGEGERYKLGHAGANGVRQDT